MILGLRFNLNLKYFSLFLNLLYLITLRKPRSKYFVINLNRYQKKLIGVLANKKSLEN